MTSPRCKVLCTVAGSVLLLVAGATTFRLVTGKCPIGCLIETINGKPAAPANAN